LFAVCSSVVGDGMDATTVNFGFNGRGREFRRNEEHLEEDDRNFPNLTIWIEGEMPRGVVSRKMNIEHSEAPGCLVPRNRVQKSTGSSFASRPGPSDSS
jgi:hypothetical protein